VSQETFSEVARPV